MTKKKNILLIGGAGYIGGLTCDRLIKNGFNVTVYDNLLYETRFFKNVNFVYGDIRDKDKILNLSKDYDIIVLLAAIVGDLACDINKKITEDVNYISIANICLNINPDKHIIYISTCSVFGQQNGLLNEDSPVMPLSFYAETKLKAEDCVLKRNGTVLRLGTVFGMGDTYSRVRLDLVVNTLTARAYKYKEITISGGNQWRPIIAVSDVADYITECCIKKQHGVYIISKENITMQGIAEKIINIIPETKIKYLDLPDKDIRNYRVDNSKSLSSFNFTPVTTIEYEASKMLKMFNEQRIVNVGDENYNNCKYLLKITRRNAI